MCPSLRGTRDPKEQSWADAEERVGRVSLRSEGHRSKGQKDQRSTHSSSCFLTKVTLRSVQSRINKSKKEVISTQGAWNKTHNCMSMCTHIQRIKVILSTLRENYISGFRCVYSAMLWNSRVRSVLSMTLALENTSAIQEENTIHSIQRRVGVRYYLHLKG